MKVDPVDPVHSSAFSLAIACGPFTADSDLAYAPFASMIEALQKDKPSALLLVLIFLYSSSSTDSLSSLGWSVRRRCTSFHSSRRFGRDTWKAIPTTDLRVFEDILGFLSRQYNNPPAWDTRPHQSTCSLSTRRVIFWFDPKWSRKSDLLSSFTDFHRSSVIVVYQRIYLVPNPARFKINDVTFGVSSVDVLFHLRREEFTRTGREEDPMPMPHGDDIGTDAMANLCRHLIQQRRYDFPSLGSYPTNQYGFITASTRYSLHRRTSHMKWTLMLVIRMVWSS